MIKVILEDYEEQRNAEQYFNTTNQYREKVLLQHDVLISDLPEVCRTYLEKKEAVIAVLKDDRSFPGVLYAVMDWHDVDQEYAERVYRRYHRLPWDICQTQRCFIRETTVQDVEYFYDIYKEKSITRYMEDLFPNPEDEKQYIRDYRDKIYSFYNFGMWTVCLKETGQVIGRAGLSMREGFSEPELGYMIGVPWQRRGLAEEVCREILRYGKEKLEMTKFQTLIERGNSPSERLCRKLGFQWKEQVWIGSKCYDRYLF